MNTALQIVHDCGRKHVTAVARRRFISAARHVRKTADQTFVLRIAHTGTPGA